MFTEQRDRLDLESESLSEFGEFRDVTGSLRPNA